MSGKRLKQPLGFVLQKVTRRVTMGYFLCNQ